MDKTCAQCKKEFQIEADDRAFYADMQVPDPTLCPPCRLERRLSFRNERALYKKHCVLCKKEVLSSYAPENPHTTYCQKCWWSDGWDGADYGQDFDFSRPFFEQFKELWIKTPSRSLFSFYETLVNSDNTNLVSNLKNCYLIFNSDYDENCTYGTEIEHSKDCYDSMMIDGCEQSAGNVNCHKCYKTFYSTNCESCQDTWLSQNCSGCSNIFGCVNLKNKQYYIFNQPYSKEEYFKKLEGFRLGSYAAFKELQREAHLLALKNPERFMQGKQVSNVSGEYIYNSKDVRNTYVATEAQNCKYCMWLLVPSTKDCWDYTEFGDNASRVYDSLTCGGGASNIRFSQFVGGSSFISYSAHIASSQNLFGCVNMKKKQYCILNKQYTKEEYEALVPKIIEHMKEGGEYGEFFPMYLSPFPYNDTNAYEFFRTPKDKIEERGLHWRDADTRNYTLTKEAKDLPDSGEETADSITNDIIACEHQGTCDHQCTTAYRILPQELVFYKLHKLPLPRMCPNCRHYERFDRRRSKELHPRACMCRKTSGHFHGEGKCPNKFETSFAPGKPEIVYCEQCYQAEVA